MSQKALQARGSSRLSWAILICLNEMKYFPVRYWFASSFSSIREATICFWYYENTTKKVTHMKMSHFLHCFSKKMLKRFNSCFCNTCLWEPHAGNAIQDPHAGDAIWDPLASNPFSDRKYINEFSRFSNYIISIEFNKDK